MRRGLILAAAAVVTVISGVLGAPASFGSVAANVNTPGYYQAIPRPVCGPGSNPETGFQGEVPLTDRLAGFKGFSCNLKLVGHYQGEGASWQHAWYGTCDYYDTANNQGTGPAKLGAQKHLGTVVLDVANPRHPRVTEYLTTPGMLHPWEDLKVNKKRGLLAGAPNGGPPFDVYDVSKDCAHPRLLASVPMPNNGHEGEWEPDGRTYWGSSTQEYHAIDVTDPTHPREILTWKPAAGGTHGLSFSDDGDTAYVCDTGLPPVSNTEDGIQILDISDIQHRRPHPKIRVIGSIYWPDSTECQTSTPITIGGHHYLVMSSELGSGGLTHQSNYGCATGLLPYGIPRIINIDNPRHPKLVAKLTLQTDDPANCAIATQETAGQVIFGYDSHYCSVDQQHNATALACGYFNSGVRLFDIRDPYHPKEIAYFNPPAQLDTTPVGTGSEGGVNSALAGSEHIGSKDADWCSNRSRFYHAPDGTWQLWVTCQDYGFMVLQVTNHAYPLGPSSPARRASTAYAATRTATVPGASAPIIPAPTRPVPKNLGTPAMRAALGFPVNLDAGTAPLLDRRVAPDRAIWGGAALLVAMAVGSAGALRRRARR